MSKILAVGCIAFFINATVQAGAVGGPQKGEKSGGGIEIIRFKGGQEAVFVLAVNGGGNVRIYDSSGRLVKRVEVEGPKWDITWVVWTPDQTEDFKIEIGAAREHVFKTN